MRCNDSVLRNTNVGKFWRWTKCWSVVGLSKHEVHIHRDLGRYSKLGTVVSLVQPCKVRHGITAYGTSKWSYTSMGSHGRWETAGHHRIDSQVDLFVLGMERILFFLLERKPKGLEATRSCNTSRLILKEFSSLKADWIHLFLFQVDQFVYPPTGGLQDLLRLLTDHLNMSKILIVFFKSFSCATFVQCSKQAICF